MSKKVKRLFESFEPAHYVLDLVPDKEVLTFTGKVTITGRKKGRPSRRLTFHQKGLKITRAGATFKDKKTEKPISFDRINTHDSFDELRLHSKELLYPGQYTVELEFSGKITRSMDGIYPCFFTLNGQEEKLIATQFESHFARQVFPCIDEPEAKAIFDLTLTVPKSEVVVANTPIASTKIVGTMQQTTFETTPKMSSYLLAFVYGKLEYKETKTKDGVVIRAYATPENVGYTQYALDCAVKCLEFYNEYFDIPYPLPKYDMVALPDFAAGAMENWGLITYREQAMLVDEANTSLPTKQHVAVVVAHELAHQWFGNLVTMRWWTDLWLNEGFASWIEYLAVDHMYPQWDMWTQFVVDELQPAFKLDALENTHPIEVPINHPDEIRTIFDTISYNKGSSAIRMLHDFLGPTAFRDGLRHYLKQHKYGNTDTVDLWAALEEVSKKPVKQFMHAWTSLPGHPIVLANVAKNNVSLKQERFYFNQKSREASKPTIWPIPLLSEDNKAPDSVSQAAESFSVSQGDTFRLNHGQSAFYRSMYNSEHLAKLGEQVRQGALPPVDRLGLLSDAFDAARAGYSNTVDALRLLTYYENEDNAAVWDIIAGGVLGVRAVLADEKLREDMKPFIRQLIATQLKRLGWEAGSSESHFDKLLRLTILGMASVADEPSVVDKALGMFSKMKKSEDVTPDFRALIYNTAARNGAEPEYQKLLKLYGETNSSEEKVNLASALTGFKQPALIKQSLNLIKTDAVRLQDVAYWVVYSFMNRYAKDMTWEWFKEHWEWMAKDLAGDPGFPRLPVYAARAFTDKSFLKDYDAFFAPNLTPLIDRAVKQGAEIVEWQADWKQREAKAVKQFFKDMG
ncbi:MAG: hypothetical protein JWS12_683 [Candidatus Saccharibacteria bacterium]|nr:hypothetical protein [Candidatus Saccharibacteria bacterium]